MLKPVSLATSVIPGEAQRYMAALGIRVNIRYQQSPRSQPTRVTKQE